MLLVSGEVVVAEESHLGLAYVYGLLVLEQDLEGAEELGVVSPSAVGRGADEQVDERSRGVLWRKHLVIWPKNLRCSTSLGIVSSLSVS